jgi:nitric oxide reductase subunit B
MTEWVIFISIIQGFKSKLKENQRLRHLTPYRFLIAAEFWVFANLILALFMSIPAINRYTHGTHITVAHAMGTTIGINTMILLGSIGYMLDIDAQSKKIRRVLEAAFQITQVSLGLFWLSLIAAGIIKGFRSVAQDMNNFQKVMKPVMTMIKVFSFTGIFLAIGLGTIAVCYINVLKSRKNTMKDLIKSKYKQGYFK